MKKTTQKEMVKLSQGMIKPEEEADIYSFSMEDYIKAAGIDEGAIAPIKPSSPKTNAPVKLILINHIKNDVYMLKKVIVLYLDSNYLRVQWKELDE